MQVWKDQPNNKHTWAFYYYLKRAGYNPLVQVDKETNTVTIIIE